ncbi:SWIM zinc finger family protein [Streptomyces sp. NPDC018057]|uniref:SWIM zinc finger family protein n=1 Tax=unclassified Streptomyces TaxID=2593676 RepID=UPI003789BD90
MRTPAEPQPPRPGDVAREALRAARRHRPQPPGTPTTPPVAPAASAPEGTEEPGSEGRPESATEPSPEQSSPEQPQQSRRSQQPSRPGDAARAALRRTAQPSPSLPPAPQHAEPATPTAPDTLAPDTPVPDRPAPAKTTAARPADIAREALRAARARGGPEEEQPSAPAEGGARPRSAAAPRARTAREARPSRRTAAQPGPSRARLPRTGGRTEGDAGSGDGTPGTGPGPGTSAPVRAVAELLAHAFRMPPAAETDDEPDDSTEDAPPGTGTGTTTATPEGDPAPARPTSPRPTASHLAVRAPVRAPGGMASPRRDGELRRTFPALPAPPTTAREGRTGPGFAQTWWGEAWTTALEDGALDTARLARGRDYARTGHVDAITVTPGLVLAYVQGSRPRPYRVQVRMRTLDDAEWDRFLDAAAERPGHIAALLDKEMPQSLADCGVPLLPGPYDLDPHCSCPDRGHPCKHAAALCYQTARLLDADPFVLLLLRGRGERELLDALSRRSAARAARDAQDRDPEPLPGERATEALARRPLPLPAPLPPPPHPGQPPAYPSAPGGPDPFALDQLATDAAARAHALLTTGRDPVGGLTLWQDAVRLAAARPGSGLTAATRSLYASLASATGRTTAELARAVAAWRQGAAEGLAVLEDPWDPPAGRFDRARPLLLAAGLPPFRPHRNRLTHPAGRLQLRLGRDHLWYAYESEPGRDDWWPRGTPAPDPVDALSGVEAWPTTPAEPRRSTRHG